MRRWAWVEDRRWRTGRRRTKDDAQEGGGPKMTDGRVEYTEDDAQEGGGPKMTHRKVEGRRWHTGRWRAEDDTCEGGGRKMTHRRVEGRRWHAGRRRAEDDTHEGGGRNMTHWKVEAGRWCTRRWRTEDDAQESGGWKMTHRKVEGRRWRAGKWRPEDDAQGGAERDGSCSCTQETTGACRRRRNQKPTIPQQQQIPMQTVHKSAWPYCHSRVLLFLNQGVCMHVWSTHDVSDHTYWCSFCNQMLMVYHHEPECETHTVHTHTDMHTHTHT